MTCKRQLSTPMAYKAAKACSTVLQRASPRPKTVPRVVSTTFSATASIMGRPSRSIRCILYPWFSGAGLNVTVRFRPVCNPLPHKEKLPCNVFCFSIALYFFLFSISFKSSISFFKWFTSAYISGSFLYTTLERAKFLASMAGEPCTVMCPLRMLPAIPA